MRRIDLFCKLIAPLFISFIYSYSTKVAVWTVFGLNTVWVVVEYLAIAKVSTASTAQLHNWPQNLIRI
jgi:iron-regulated transporter 1